MPDAEDRQENRVSCSQPFVETTPELWTVEASHLKLSGQALHLQLSGHTSVALQTKWTDKFRTVNSSEAAKAVSE